MRITFPRDGVRTWCEEEQGFIGHMWLVPMGSRGSAASRFKAGSCPTGALRDPQEGEDFAALAASDSRHALGVGRV